jgi:hypothetical protein
MRPVRELTAKSRPSVEPKYAIPSTTTGEDSTLPGVSTRQRRRPFSRSSANTVPSCELTISRGPSMAGVEGFVPPTVLCQSVLPVSALMA